MEKIKIAQILGLALVLTATAGCSASGSKSLKSASSSEPTSGASPESPSGPESPAEASNNKESTVETAVDYSASAVGGEGATLIALGGAVSQIELPLVGAITDGSGKVVTNLGEGANSLSAGLSDGLGSIGTNDNAVGTTLAGGTGMVSQTGEAVTELGGTLGAINTLPVLAQIDGKTGLLTDLGGTAVSLGGVVTQAGDGLTFTFTDPDSAIGGLTTELTAIVRPVVATVDGSVQNLGNVLVVGPLASNLLAQVGTAVFVLGGSITSDNIAALGDVGAALQGDGQLLLDLASILDNGDDGSSSLFDLGGGLELDGSVTDTVGGLTGGDAGLVGSVTDTVGGLTGGDAGLVGSVTETVGGLTDGDAGLVDTVTDTVGGLTGGLLK